MERPCDYCGTDLPHGVDLRTRRIRSFHFAYCEVRLKRVEEHRAEDERVSAALRSPQSADRDALDAAISALELDADWRVRQEAANGLREMRERIA